MAAPCLRRLVTCRRGGYMYLATMLATHPFLRASPGFLVFLPPASGFGGCIDFVVISVRRQQQRCGCAVSVVCGVRCGRTRGPLGSWQRTEYNKGCALIEDAFRERLHEESNATARRSLPRASRERERTRRGRAKRRKYTEKAQRRSLRVCVCQQEQRLGSSK